MNRNVIDILWNRSSFKHYAICNVKRIGDKFSLINKFQVVRFLPNGKKKVLYVGTYIECQKYVVRNNIPVSSVHY